MQRNERSVLVNKKNQSSTFPREFNETLIFIIKNRQQQRLFLAKLKILNHKFFKFFFNNINFFFSKFYYFYYDPVYKKMLQVNFSYANYCLTEADCLRPCQMIYAGNFL